MKKITLILMSLIILLISGCSKETSDQLQNLSDKNNKYVLMVKNGNPTSYPDSTYGKSFEDFFGSPTWKYFKSDDGRDIVEFTGDCTYYEVQVKARLQFILDTTGGTFEAGALSFNDVPQTQLITAAIFSKVFEDATPKTTAPSATSEPTTPVVASERTASTKPNTTTPELSYIPYTNDRFGFSIDYPSIFTKSSLPDNGDGITLSTEDGSTELIVYGSNNNLNETPTSTYNNLLKEHSDAPYKKQGGNWMVVSWIEGDKIAYQKSVVGNGSINTFIIKYPSNQNDYYSSIISQLNSSLKTPAIESVH